MTTVRDIYNVLFAFAPASMKMDWDNVGLLCGRFDAPVDTVLVALDPMPDVIDEAKKTGAQCIVTHHPLFFDAPRAVNDASYEGRCILELAEAKIAAINLHTNLDVCPGGVNDVLALKDADCSVAMAAGSEAAQHVSQMVLLDSNFAALPHIVREGRRVINNIERSASLFLVKNIFSFLVSLVLLFLPAVYPLVPAQISLISALFIGAPSFLLTFEPSFGRIQGHFLRNILLNALPGGLTNVVTIFTMLAVGQALALPLEQVSTLCALLVGVNGFLVLLFLCWPLTGFRGLVLALMAAGFAGAVVFLSPLFQLATLTTQSWQLFALMAAAAPALMAVFTFLVSRVKARLRVSDPAPRRARAFS